MVICKSAIGSSIVHLGCRAHGAKARLPSYHWRLALSIRIPQPVFGVPPALAVRLRTFIAIH